LAGRHDFDPVTRGKSCSGAGALGNEIAVVGGRDLPAGKAEFDQ
jgi:hypothetical protein